PELQYVVVKDRAHAASALSIVKDVTKGRLDCLLLDGDTPIQTAQSLPGATPVCEILRFDDRVKHIANSFKNAYVVESLENAWDLAAQYPEYRFVTMTGEVIHDHVIGWGEREALGPLSLKREIRELDRQLDKAVRDTVAREAETVRLDGLVKDTEA